MIRHFETIKNLGVFADYKKPAQMARFERFNLIYGLNGSGKTTLSRFFADLNTGTAKGFENLKYRIDTDDGKFAQGQPYTRKIRVFNSEYVDANIGELEGQLNPIFVIGEDNKKLVAIVEKDEKDLESLTNLHEKKTDEVKKLEAKRGKYFTDIAREISTNAAGTSARTYRKNDAEKAFGKLGGSQKLSLQELTTASNAMSEQALAKLPKQQFEAVSLQSSEKSSIDLFTALEIMEYSIAQIVNQSATSIVVQRLVENPDISEWVELGVEVHKNHDPKTCEYCLQPIQEKRAEALTAHFNDSDKLLKGSLEQHRSDLEQLRKTLQEFQALSNSSFYQEFKQPYDTSIEVLSGLKIGLLNHLVELDKVLTEKLQRRTDSYSVDITSFDAEPYKLAIERTNTLIQNHNDETDEFEARLESNRSKIEAHYLSTLIDPVAETDKEISAISKTLEQCNEGQLENGELGISALESRIKENRLKISNSHQAAKDLSEKLASFLGRDDLRFEAEGEGYRIMRFGRAAKRLSEGEKTAITFLYFVVGLKDQDFDLEEGIVVIDDPISSLDSSSVYQAFSYLKNAVKDAKQIFLLTHNFEFLKLLLDWLGYGNQNSKSYWMLHCTSTGGTQRETDLKPLDKILLQNKNEFAYLFKILVEFESDGSIATAYPIPNIARKVLESFLAQHSTGKSFHQKLENLDYDEAKKGALYKYTNDLSHPTLSGLDPALIGETQTNVKHLIEMIKDRAPVHYKALTDTIAASN